MSIFGCINGVHVRHGEQPPLMLAGYLHNFGYLQKSINQRPINLITFDILKHRHSTLRNLMCTYSTVLPSFILLHLPEAGAPTHTLDLSTDSPRFVFTARLPRHP